MSDGRVRITIDANLDDPAISTTLTVRPQTPFLDVAHILRLLVEAIETGQIESLQLGGPRE